MFKYKYRIITKGIYFYIQKRYWLLFWKNISYTTELNDKRYEFETIQNCEKYIEKLKLNDYKEKPKKKVVKYI